jgi:hypothetical protein
MNYFTVPAGHMLTKGAFFLHNKDVIILSAEFMGNCQTYNPGAYNNGIKFK